MHNGEEDDENMAYNWNSHQVSPYWPDMASFIKSKKPITNGDEDMKLEKIYKKGSRGIGVKFIQMVVNEYMKTNLVIDGIWGTKTEEGVKAFQEANGLAVDGIVGPATFPAMIEAYPKLWDKIQYLYAIGG
jgi:peptidoglycan hydrolase-like protein with peptidoglycan-binding domain